MTDSTLSRRSALGLTAVTAMTTMSAVSLAAAGPRRALAQAATPAAAPSHPPRWIRFPIGSGEGIVVSDGSTWLSPIQPTFAAEATKSDLDAALTRAFHPRDRARIDFNVACFRLGDTTILVDAGSGGAGIGRFGKAREHLVAAGVEPASVDLVLVTHAHGDHIGGLLDAERKPMYPNARIAIGRTEHDFWTGATPDLSRSRLPPDRKEQMVVDTQRTLATLKDRIDLIDPATTLHPRIELLPTYGHTPGHLSLIVKGEGSEGDLCVLADVAHNHVAMFADPDWTAIFDVDPTAAAKTRRALFDRLSAEPMRVLAYHLPWPGFGWVRRQGHGYEWVIDGVFV